MSSTKWDVPEMQQFQRGRYKLNRLNLTGSETALRISKLTSLGQDPTWLGCKIAFQHAKCLPFSLIYSFLSELSLGLQDIKYQWGHQIWQCSHEGWSWQRYNVFRSTIYFSCVLLCVFTLRIRKNDPTFL